MLDKKKTKQNKAQKIFTGFLFFNEKILGICIVGA